MKSLPGFILTILLLTGCVDPYNPEISGYESLYVVDGELNNLPGPYEIRVLQSFEYENEEPEMVSDAQVTIKDNLGNEEILTEVEQGVYHTSESFQGQPGRQYQLRIEIDEHTVLESDFEELKEPVPIDSVYWEYVDRPHADDHGAEIFLDTHAPTTNAEYYAWEYEEYWRYQVAFLTDDYPGEFRCWDSSMYHSLILGTTAGYAENTIKRQSLYYIDHTTNRLERRYSTRIKQYVLTEEAYQFYDQLQSLNENTGTLFDPVPYSIVGNMHYAGQEDIPVLGLFLVTSISDKRIYIDKRELPTQFVPEDPFDDCSSYYIQDTDSTAEEIDSLVLNGSHVYDSIFIKNPENLENPVDTFLYFTSKRECFLCSLTGSQEPPDFWEDE